MPSFECSILQAKFSMDAVNSMVAGQFLCREVLSIFTCLELRSAVAVRGG